MTMGMRLGMALAAGAAAVVLAAGPGAAQQSDVSERPSFTPYTKKPEIRSAVAVRDAMRALYPPLLRDAGIGGTAIYWLFIDRTGEVGKVQLHRSSGYDELDAAAAKVAVEMRFLPAQNRDRPVDVWVQMPITFSPDAAGAPSASDRRQPARVPERARAGDVTEAPTFTPYTEAPTLANQSEVAVALQAAYPPLLRDAGIGGTAQVWFLIGADGSVLKSQIAHSSGQEPLDQAALSVARRMRFNPARNRGDDVLVWVQIPVTFSSR